MLFLLTFLAIYGGVNAYFFWKVSRAFGPGRRWRLALAGLLLLMMSAPVLSVILDRRQHFRLASALSLVGFLWVAVVFWFLVLGLLTDVWNGALWCIGLALPRARRARLPRRLALGAIGAVIAVGLCWGWIEARSVRTVRVTIDVPVLPNGMPSLKLVQITDLHLGAYTGEGRLSRIVRLIEQAEPDILVSTGDLADSPVESIRSMAARLGEIRAPLGKFAVLGNHEFYAGLGNSFAFHREAGFRVLREEFVTVGGVLRIAGVDDPAGRRVGQRPRLNENAILPAHNDNPVTILLKHRPTVSDASLGRFKLQLSGHAHGGQIFPWHVVTALQYRFYNGLHAVGRGSFIYVSRGAGTWGPALRVLAPPEVTVIVLRRSPSPSE
jgi:hypothetical protein